MTRFTELGSLDRAVNLLIVQGDRRQAEAHLSRRERSRKKRERENANKIPAVLGPIAENEDARRFFRRAAKTIKSPEGWRDLLDYLEKRG